MSNIAIIGSGSFGCALAQKLSKNNNVKVWSYTEEETNMINNEHKCMFLDVNLDPSIKCYQSYEDAIKDTNYIFLVVPSKVFRETCKQLNHT